MDQKTEINQPLRKVASSNDSEAPSTNKLFRSQSVEHATVRQYGDIILTQPLSRWIVTLFFFIIAVLIVLFFSLFETSRKVNVPGIVTPAEGLIRVVPYQEGVITEVKVKEGEVVKKDQVLFIVTSEKNIDDNKSIELRVTTLLEERRKNLLQDFDESERQNLLRQAAFEDRIRSLKEEADRIALQVSLQRTRVSLAEEKVRRFIELKNTNYISSAQVEEREAELIEQRQKLISIEREQASNRKDVAREDAENRDMISANTVAKNTILRNINSLDQEIAENSARKLHVILSPKNGVITGITGFQGKTVMKTDSIATILPTGGSLEVELYVPSKAIGFIKPGSRTMLRYEAFPFQKFGQHTAYVKEISSAAIRSTDLINASPTMVGSLQEVYRVRLTLERQTVKALGEEEPLRPGMLVDASVMLERRKLYEWILDPLISVSGKN